jgi:hypothetical protein
MNVRSLVILSSKDLPSILPAEGSTLCPESYIACKDSRGKPSCSSTISSYRVLFKYYLDSDINVNDIRIAVAQNQQISIGSIYRIYLSDIYRCCSDLHGDVEPVHSHRSRQPRQTRKRAPGGQRRYRPDHQARQYGQSAPRGGAGDPRGRFGNSAALGATGRSGDE